ACIANIEHDLARCEVCSREHARAAVEGNRHIGRRDTPIAYDREKTLGIAVEVLAEKRALSGIDLETGRSTRLDAGEHPDQPFGGLAPWRAVGHDAVRRQLVMKDVVPGRKRIRLMEADAPHGG